MDDINLVIGGVALIPLVFGLVEFFKSAFNLEGKAVTWMAAGIGLVLAVVAQLESIVPGIAPWVKLVVLGLCTALATSGNFKFLNARLPKTERPYTG
jgi:hypothetical protein